MSLYLSSTDVARDLDLRDLSDPDQGPHAMQLLLAAVTDALSEAWRMPTRVIRLSPLVSVQDNYDRLGFDPGSVTRERRYSRYVSPTVMLRSHTSAWIPWALTTLPTTDPVDELLVLPGLAYRRDAIDRTHVGAPHQVDLWRIASRPGLGVDDLAAMVATIVDAVLPGAEWRLESRVHPYTTEGQQVDVRVDGEWLELAECGLVARHVIEGAGLDPDRWSGLALGMGLDRALMLRKGLDDIRLLRSTDPRIHQQMLGLERWRPVSMMPPIRRDISVVVDAGEDEETIGDAVRAALGDRVDDLEAVSVLATTSWADLHPRARERLALRPDQKNALIRISLRPLSSTMTDEEANALRDAVYLALHEGPVLELIDG